MKRIISAAAVGLALSYPGLHARPAAAQALSNPQVQVAYARPRVGGFILLSDGYDAELSADFEGDGKPLIAAELYDQKLPDKLDAKLFEKP
jgi:hypothetical protein